MAEYDYVVSSLKVKQSSVFSLQGLYKVIKSWLTDNGYSVGESDYTDTDRKHTTVTWSAKKKADDYSRFIIEIKLSAKNLEHAEVKGKKLQKGEVEVSFSSYLQSDYEDYWEQKGTSKFMRGVYDKFALKSKMNKYSEELKEDTYDIYNEVKAYLKLHVLK